MLKPFITKYPLTADGINGFLSALTCKTITKDSYFKAIRAFINWWVRNEYLEDNLLKRVDPPKPEKRVLPSLTHDQVDYLIDYVDNLRDKTIISLLADSGMRVNELANMKPENFDWETNTIFVLISRDIDFADLLQNFRERGVSTYVITPDNTSLKLI